MSMVPRLPFTGLSEALIKNKQSMFNSGFIGLV
jgi:hypothetical protein